jgi:hypothetical protein
MMKAGNVKPGTGKCCWLLFSLLLAVTCSKDSSGPDESYCDRLTIANGQPAILWDCDGSISGTTSNITYDTYGRIIAMDFDWECSNSSEAYEGRFYNIVRNQYAQATAFDAVINGETCHYP